jgi:hypothetical protein
MWKTSRYLKLYFASTMAYSFAHTVPRVWSFKTVWYPGCEKKEYLWVDKVGMVTMNTVMGPFCWPVRLREDLVQLECRVRGKAVKDYLPANDDA